MQTGYCSQEKVLLSALNPPIIPIIAVSPPITVFFEK
jgi:hypothetical protein